LAGCGRRPGSGFDGYALIATAGEKSIAVADLSNFRLAREVPVGGSPSAVVTAAAASYVLTPETGSLHAINRSLECAASRKLADRLCDVRISADQKRLFAPSAAARELIEVDAQTLAPAKRWKLAAEPTRIAVSVDGSVAMSSAQGGTLEFLDAKTGRIARRDFDGPIGEVIFRTDGKLLLVANHHQQSLTALEVPSLQIMVDLPLAMQPQNLCFNADGGQLFITGHGMDGIAIAFPYLPLEIEQTILAGRDPGAMACSEDPAYLLVASASGSSVYVVNIDDRKILGIVEVGQKPCFLAVTPDSQYALVLNEASADMAVIRIPSIQERIGNPAVMRGKSAAALFTMLPVGARPVHAAIVRKQA
jgi:DNA-binding beta-propeller fold protein YncE